MRSPSTGKPGIAGRRPARDLLVILIVVLAVIGLLLSISVPRFMTGVDRSEEAVLRQNIDKRNFRKKLLAMGVVKPLQDREQDVAHRAAQLYQFDRRAYQQRIKKGLPFELS